MPSPLVVVGSLFGAFVALAGASVVYRQQRRLSRFERTTGQVVASGVEPRTSFGWHASDADPDGATDPAIEYEYRVGAVEYTNDTVWPAGIEPTRRRFRGGASGFAAAVADRFPEGEPVTVYYDPADPADAFLVPARNWAIPAVCSVFVAVLGVWAAHCTGVVYVPFGEFNC